LIFEGKSYPPTAIVGLAGRRFNNGHPLTPEEFSGAEGSAQANQLLRSLAFTVVRKSGAEGLPNDRAPRVDWEDWEVAIAIDAYFELLHAQLDGKHVVKKQLYSDVARRLRPERRNKPKAVEYKFQNISAVLDREQLRWASGLTPAWNYQHLLEWEVVSYLDGPSGERQFLAKHPQAWEEQQPNPQSADLEVQPPNIKPPRDGDRTRVTRLLAEVASRDEANRRLGRLGEEWAFNYEQRRLAAAQRPRLADQVDWVAQTRGDGLGYDILSFSANGEERWLEVKTTGASKTTPFLVTPNERTVWEANVYRYRVFRIFGFGDDPRFYRLKGEPTEIASWKPGLWEVRPGGIEPEL
jgi:Protein NO VEIN, C-terminal